MLEYYLYGRPKPFLTGLTGGFAHPFILLSDAVELGSPILAADALALTATDYNALAKVLELPLPDNPDAGKKPLLDVLKELRADSALDAVVPKPGIENIRVILSNHTAGLALGKYLPALDLAPANEENLLHELVRLGTQLLLCTHAPGTPAFDFYLNHSLTFSNSAAILLPVVPPPHRPMLLRIVWLMTLLAYTTQLRPVVTPSLLEDSVPEKGWEEIKAVALGGVAGRTADPHFVKALHILSRFAGRWPDDGDVFLKAANKLVREFEDWTGFGNEGELKLNVAA